MDHSPIALSTVAKNYGGPHVPRQEQIHHGKSKFITARANYSRQEQITHGKSKLLTAKQKSNHWSAVWSAVVHLPLYNFMLCKHYSLSLNIPQIPGDPLETKRKQNKTRKIRQK
jgi:hypothetical protein